MDKETAEEFKANHDMPHEELLDRLGIDFEDLSPEIKESIRQFDVLFERALDDGYVDDEEEDQLILFSYRIAEQIKEQHVG